MERSAAVASLHAQNAHLEVTALVYSSVRDYVPEDRALRCAKVARLVFFGSLRFLGLRVWVLNCTSYR